jgi:thiamine-phosphate pyrophosphorylase
MNKAFFEPGPDVMNSPLASRLKAARLYLVTDQELSENSDTPKTVDEALKGGVDIVQLREYSLNDSELLFMARKVRELTKSHNALFIVNNRPDIARLSDADGVHLGQDDLPVVEARKILGEGKLVGVSTHGMNQAKKAVAEGADYIGVGPVYPTQTKRNAVPSVTLEYVKQVAASGLNVPFFAIGGIKLHNLEEVLKAGARRVAVVTGIVATLNVQKVAFEFKEMIQKYPL